MDSQDIKLEDIDDFSTDDFNLLIDDKVNLPEVVNDALKIKNEINNDEESNDSMTYSQIFDVNVPIVGQMTHDELNKHNTPFVKNYELAKLRNKNRLQTQIRNGEYMIKSKRVIKREKSEVKRNKFDSNNSWTEDIENHSEGVWLLQMFATAMQNLTIDKETDFEGAISAFEQIDQRPISAKSLIVAYPIVNFTGKCRFHKDQRVRQSALKLFSKFQALFAILDGETFEATFAKEVMAHHKVAKREE